MLLTTKLHSLYWFSIEYGTAGSFVVNLQDIGENRQKGRFLTSPTRPAFHLMRVASQPRRSDLRRDPHSSHPRHLTRVAWKFMQVASSQLSQAQLRPTKEVIYTAGLATEGESDISSRNRSDPIRRRLKAIWRGGRPGAEEEAIRRRRLNLKLQSSSPPLLSLWFAFFLSLLFWFHWCLSRYCSFEGLDL